MSCACTCRFTFVQIPSLSNVRIILIQEYPCIPLTTSVDQPPLAFHGLPSARIHKVSTECQINRFYADAHATTLAAKVHSLTEKRSPQCDSVKNAPGSSAPDASSRIQRVSLPRARKLSVYTSKLEREGTVVRVTFLERSLILPGLPT